jgi:predicted DNA-binding transcriptional regulator YafY
VKERTWHKSQQFRDRADGSTLMTLEVTDDYALRRWILSFGSGVRVLSPASLVEWALDELDAARQEYGGHTGRPDSSVQPPLPFSLFGVASA